MSDQPTEQTTDQTSSPAPASAPGSGAGGQTKPEGQWTDLCGATEIPATGGKFVGLKTHALAIFRLEGEKLQVMDDTCPHAGGSLASGYVSSGKVYCPWHGWPFNLANGVCPDNDCIKVQTYENRIVDGRLQAKL